MTKKVKLFLIDDDELIISMLSRVLKKDGYEVHSETGTHNIIEKIRSSAPDVVFLDIDLPEKNGMDILEEIMNEKINTQVIMLTADDTAETAVKAMKLGAVDYLTKPFNTDEVKIVLNSIIEKESLRQEVTYLRKVYSENFEKNLLGESAAIKELKEKMVKMARARVSTVLITGESGTGKEIISRNIHNLIYGTEDSKYSPFISINCAAMPESILESELFGYEKGSFTDAKSSKKGLFEMADGGSILLDEIGDMRTDLQSKLLRVLEERTVRHIGGKDEIPIDLTVIATTNRNLKEAVNNNEFRQDLFFRLSTFYLHVVPLRERQEDIPIMAKYFLAQYTGKYNKKIIKGFSPEAEETMVSYSWPGNIRELKNLVERFVVLEDKELIGRKDLPGWMFGGPESSMTPAPSGNNGFILPETGISLEDVEKDIIIQAMNMAKNNRTQAAKLLNISYDTLRYQLKKYGL